MPPQPWKRPADDGEAILFMLKHPLRRVVLVAYREGLYSPKQLSGQLDEELRLVAYHTRALKFYGAIDLVEETSARGSTEHFYKANELGKRALAVAEKTGVIERREGSDGEGADG
jgi:hypothetical protein